jgi:AraC family transcriptional regulator
LAKIALAVRDALARRRALGEPGRAVPRVLASGAGWSVADVVCTSGPQDRPFEEQHTQYSIAIVLAGSFQYKSRAGKRLMTPGSLMLGNPGQYFECGHEHADGDRCVSFWYAPEYFEQLLADTGHNTAREFAISRIPPLRSLAPVVASTAANILATGHVSWDELAIRLASCAAGATADTSARYRAPMNAERRVTSIVRLIDAHPDRPLTLETMAEEAGLSPYHFLRTFERQTGVTPHQYILRARLREAAIRLSTRTGKILDIALDCGFGDVSNFNRAFRAEFGVNPRAYQQRA